MSAERDVEALAAKIIADPSFHWSGNEGELLAREVARLTADRERLVAALEQIEALAGKLEGRHTGFVHIGRMARLALRTHDRAALTPQAEDPEAVYDRERQDSWPTPQADAAGGER